MGFDGLVASTNPTETDSNGHKIYDVENKNNNNDYYNNNKKNNTENTSNISINNNNEKNNGTNSNSNQSVDNNDEIKDKKKMKMFIRNTIIVMLYKWLTTVIVMVVTQNWRKMKLQHQKPNRQVVEYSKMAKI